jgi:hypothetical protein
VVQASAANSCTIGDVITGRGARRVAARSVRKMSNEEAARHAALVVRVFAALARTDLAATRRAPRPVMTSPIVQLFAADA